MSNPSPEQGVGLLLCKQEERLSLIMLFSRMYGTHATTIPAFRALVAEAQRQQDVIDRLVAPPRPEAGTTPAEAP